jgi:hypothetical protein
MLDLLVPRLLLPPDAPEEMRAFRMPELERWLAAADISRTSAQDANDWIAEVFALPRPIPVAPIALASDDAPHEGSWLRADPVHLRLERDSARLYPATTLSIEATEAQALVESLRGHFRSDGVELVAPSPERWYVRVPEGEMPETTPLDRVVGRGIQAAFPRSRGRINWRTALTEAQMLLGMHEVNAQRESRGKPAINSVWFWGGGAAPAPIPRPYARIVADEAFARGLGILAGSKVEAVNAAPIVAQESTLFIDDAMVRPFDAGNAAKWIEAAAQLDRTRFEALGRIVDGAGTVRLVLPGDRGTVVAALRRPSLLQRLRKPKPFAAYA